MLIRLCPQIIGRHHRAKPMRHGGSHQCHCSFFWGYEKPAVEKELEYQSDEED